MDLEHLKLASPNFCLIKIDLDLPVIRAYPTLQTAQLDNGAVMSVVWNGSTIWLMPIADNNCQIRQGFRLPDEWAGTTMNLKILYVLSVSAQTYTTLLQIGSEQVGGNLSTSAANAYNAALVFPAGVANILAEATIALNDADLAPGSNVGVSIKSTVANNTALYILNIWLEE